MLAIVFPNFNPVAIQLGPVGIYWYSLAYLVGIIIGAVMVIYLSKSYTTMVISNKLLEDMVVWAVCGIIIGGRLGYVLFYNLDHAIKDPVWVFQTWKGGMSFHGGIFGIAIAVFLYCRHQKLNFIKIIDLISCVAPIGLFLGRIANFINGELYGRVANVSWAVIFPDGGPYPRHPSQLYEAGSEGIALGIIMISLFYFTKLREKPGSLAGLFLICYSLFRAVVEQYRQPDENIGLLWGNISMGQLLSAPLLLTGIYLLLSANSRVDKSPEPDHSVAQNK